MAGHGGLLLATAGGEEAEQQERDQAEDQDIHELDAFEAIAHEHRGEQAAGGQTGQRTEPARGAAGSGCLTASLIRCGLGLLEGAWRVWWLGAEPKLLPPPKRLAWASSAKVS